MEMPEFTADLYQEIAAARAALSLAREAGDEEGALAYEVRLASLRRIAAENGIDLGPEPGTGSGPESG